jgi:tetratricopeptide (TPR) repeat protein
VDDRPRQIVGKEVKFSKEARELELSKAARLLELGRIEHEQGRYLDAQRCFEAGLELSRRHGDQSGEAKALGNLGTLFQDQGQVDRGIEHLQQAIDAHRAIGDRRGEGNFIGNLGLLYGEQGQVKQAIEHISRALVIAREVGDRRGECVSLGNLGALYQKLGSLRRAHESVTRAIAIAAEVGDRRNEGVFLGNLGDVLSSMGREAEAEAALRRAIELCDETFSGAAGAFRGSLAWLLAQRGMTEEVQRLLEVGESQVRVLAHEHAKFLSKREQIIEMEVAGTRPLVSHKEPLPLGDEPHGLESGHEVPPAGFEQMTSEDESLALIEAERWLESARIESSDGHYDEAIRCYEQSLAISRRTRDRSVQGKAIGGIGTAHLMKGDQAAAVECYLHALQISRETGQKRTEAVVLGDLGLVSLHQGQHDRASGYLERALELQTEIGDRRGECINLGNLAIVCEHQGQSDRAILLYTRAVDCARELGDQTSEGVFTGNLGETFTALGWQAEAESALRESIDLCDGVIPAAGGAFRGSLAVLLAERGQSSEAHDLIRIGQEQVQSIPAEHAKFLCKAGQVYHLSGDSNGAIAALEQARVLANELKATENSEVGRALAKLESVLS